MKLSRFTEYSLRVLIYLGLRQDNRSTIKEIASAFAISRNHLMKVVSHLVRSGYVDARRGPGGGLALARPAESINLAQLVHDLEEDMNLVECFDTPDYCVIQPVCRLRKALATALDAYIQALGQFTLQDLLQPAGELELLLAIET